MAASKPVALCTLIMPSGRVCRAVALRNQKFCRAHSTTHRIYERDCALNPILDRLGDKIAAMDTSELLFFLGSQLAQLQKTFSKYPHVRYTPSLRRSIASKKLPASNQTRCAKPKRITCFCSNFRNCS